jgi:hypothetical protein
MLLKYIVEEPGLPDFNDVVVPVSFRIVLTACWQPDTEFR